MIVVFKPDAPVNEIDDFKLEMKELGLDIHESQGEKFYLVGLVGDTSIVDPSRIQSHRIVHKLIYVQEPYKKSNRLFNPKDTIVEVEGKKIGEGFFSIIAGPCSVESTEQVVSIAKSIKKSGATFLRGGAFKPRTSPYSFQGLGEKGLEMLITAKKETGLPIVSELMSPQQIEKYAEKVDVIQIGARNMQNFDLLKIAGQCKKPVLLKRGMSATIEDLLMSAEYIMASGNNNVILCERGIRSFQKATRNVLDLSAVPVIKKKSHLPIIVDPSHATGLWWLVEPMAKAAIAAGADGVMIEVHNKPDEALCDGQQSIKPERFNKLMGIMTKYVDVENKKMS